MSDTLPRLDEPGDAELISAVRGGDVSAYGPLFERHVGAARRLARQLVGSADADDLVSDAFAKVLRVLQGGGGPDVAFRAYLLTAVRRLHVDKIRAGSKLHSTDDMEAFDPGVPFRDTAVEGFESAAAAKAFASLPERWQAVLWHTEVEGQKPAEVAVLLGMSPNSVSALAYRAREGLRQAFLNSHISELDDDRCAWTHDHLGAYVRNGISKRDAAKVERHIDDCRKCMGIYLELTEVNSNLAGILAPLLLGSAGIPYLAASSLAAKGGILLFLDRGKEWVSSNAAATVAAVAGLAVVVGGAYALSGVGDDPGSQPPAASAPGDEIPGGEEPGNGPADPPPAAPPAGEDPRADDVPPASPPPVDEPVDEPVEPPVDEPVDPPVDEPVDPPVDEPTQPPAEEPPPVVDLSVTVTAEVNSGAAPQGRFAARTGMGEDYTVRVQVDGLVQGVTARITPTSSRVTLTRACASGCVVRRDAPVALLGATVEGSPASLTIEVTAVGGTEADASDNTFTLPLSPVLDLAVTAPESVTEQGNSGRFPLAATISGLADGQEARLAIQAPTGVAISGAGLDCVVLHACTMTVSTNGEHTFEAFTHHDSPFEVHYSITPVGDLVDRNDRNDRATTLLQPHHDGRALGRGLVGHLLHTVGGVLGHL